MSEFALAETISDGTNILKEYYDFQTASEIKNGIIAKCFDWRPAHWPAYELELRRADADGRIGELIDKAVFSEAVCKAFFDKAMLSDGAGVRECEAVRQQFDAAIRTWMQAP